MKNNYFSNNFLSLFRNFKMYLYTLLVVVVALVVGKTVKFLLSFRTLRRPVYYKISLIQNIIIITVHLQSLWRVIFY